MFLIISTHFRLFFQSFLTIFFLNRLNIKKRVRDGLTDIYLGPAWQSGRRFFVKDEDKNKKNS